MHEMEDMFAMKQMKYEMGESEQAPDEILDSLTRTLLSCPSLTYCCFANEEETQDMYCIPGLYFERSFKRNL